MELIQDACIDIPDGRDLIHDEVFGAGSPKAETKLWLSSIQDQSLPNDPSTTYGCTCFSLAHCVNEANAQESKAYGYETPIEHKGPDFVRQAVPLGLDVNFGWSLQGALKMALGSDLITGYVKCPDVESAIMAMSDGKMLYSGSNLINYRASNVMQAGAGPAHCFCADGYVLDEEFIWIRQSYGPERFESGRQRLRFQDFNLLFTVYALTDKRDEVKITEAQSKLRRLEAFKLGIWNAANENAPVTRYEASLMASRAGKKDQDALWNGERGTDLATRFECRTMVARATGKNYPWELKRPNDNCTRGEMAELCVR
jgi:hypothetical protein